MNLEIKDEEINIILYFIKTCCISIFAYYIATISISNKKLNIKKKIVIINYIIISSVICGIIKYTTNLSSGIIFLAFLLSIIFSIMTNNKIGYSIMIIVFSLSISYILFFISSAINFWPNIIINIQNDYLTFFFIIVTYFTLIYLLLKINRYKSGFVFLRKNLENDSIDILILNISVSVLFAIIIISNYQRDFTLNIVLSLIIFSIIMFITIQKSLQLYYKQKLLEQELNETKEELEKKKEEIKQLEAENLNFSKTSHSLAHKQRSLEYKLEQLKQKYEIAEEIEIEDKIKDISKELYNKTPEVELSKTGITEIDDMLKYMQSECIKNKIEFQLQIRGNIHEMVNNYISKEDLSILIADHVKNAIIAIKYSENINKSILVRLGKIDKIYSLYIYDSGIEFEKETLSNLGRKPSTTHADNGGTGMGFMNTFDTLKKYSASLIINEYNKPSKDNYTKSIIIKFDKNKEFKINSYRI